MKPKVFISLAIVCVVLSAVVALASELAPAAAVDNPKIKTHEYVANGVVASYQAVSGTNTAIEVVYSNAVAVPFRLYEVSALTNGVVTDVTIDRVFQLRRLSVQRGYY